MAKKVWTLDANQIAKDEIGKAIPNMPILGALVKASGVVKMDSVVNDIREEFTKKFSPKILEGNIRAVQRAYEEVSGG